MIALAIVVLALLPALIGRFLAAAVFGPGHPTATVVFVLLTYAGIVYLVARPWLRRRSQKRLHAKTLGEMLSLTPTEFERAVGQLFHDIGYRHVKHVGGSGDLAADLLCRDQEGRSVVVQCKRYAPGSRVGSRDIQSFIGMVAIHYQADRGIFVTTSEFTQPAIQLAKQHGLTLIDGETLVRLATRHQVNVAGG